MRKLPPLKQPSLSDFFEGIAAKRLTTVEVDPRRSHQHEFQGVHGLRSLLGTPEDKFEFKTKYIWLEDEEEKLEFVEASATWSDVRRAQSHRSAEYHLYYSSEASSIVHKASAGDLLIVGKKRDGSLLIIIAPAGSTAEQQIIWLFDFQEQDIQRTVVKEIKEVKTREISFATRFVLEELGIEVAPAGEDDLLDLIFSRFGAKFPTTAKFSAFARETLEDVSPLEEPDDTLVLWVEHEERLFRALERYLVAKRLETGFIGIDGPDVDDFIDFSLSVQNRRKSRVGYALEHHIEAIFQAHNIRYKRKAITENRSEPDFLFPGEKEYHDLEFPSDKLFILGVKSTCKERWRQVLPEADRVNRKHLLTLEPGISINQTNQMETQNLQLVIPVLLHSTYQPSQRAWLMSIREFLNVVTSKHSGKL